MRRLIAIVLMLLLPLQSAWALVAVPCRGQVEVNVQHVAQALAAQHANHASHHHDHDLDVADTGHHAHHAATPAPGAHPSGDGPAAPVDNPCSGSAACMSLHSPPLAPDFTAALPVLQLPQTLRPTEGIAFSSVPPAREQRPPIGLPA